jgi:hypothetical protein
MISPHLPAKGVLPASYEVVSVIAIYHQLTRSPSPWTNRLGGNLGGV